MSLTAPGAEPASDAPQNLVENVEGLCPLNLLAVNPERRRGLHVECVAGRHLTLQDLVRSLLVGEAFVDLAGRQARKGGVFLQLADRIAGP